MSLLDEGWKGEHFLRVPKKWEKVDRKNDGHFGSPIQRRRRKPRERKFKPSNVRVKVNPRTLKAIEQ